MRSAPCTPIALLVGALALTGCAGTQEPEVARVATTFEDASGDPEARCDLLTPRARERLERSGESCGDQLGSLPLEGGEVESVEVWGGDAQVRLGGDTVFLTRTSSGWKIAAAACTPTAEGPYDCEVSAS
jgi:hypothetical protein